MKGVIKLYEWIAGNMSDFTKQFEGNENLQSQARSFWRSLDNYSIVSVLIFVIIAIGVATMYYKPFNNKPGRHYLPKYWFMFWLVSFIVSLLVTFGLEYICCEPKLNGATLIEFKIALANAIYTALLFLFISIIWCNILPTNAYRIFKI